YSRRADRGREWQKPASEAFRQTHDIRHDAGKFACKHLSAAAEHGEHFVGDEQNVVLRTKLANALQKFHGMDNHSARALQQRLDNYRSDFLMPLFEQARERADAVNIASSALFSDRAAKTIRRRNAIHGKSEFLKRGDEIRVGSNRHGSDCVAMVGVLQSHETRLARSATIAPKLQCHF